MSVVYVGCFFFFKQKTAYELRISDWSSDVCSSDLANINDKTIAHQEAIILSMTKKERQNPKLLNGSRRRRIAEGSGTSVPEVNRLLKQLLQKIGRASCRERVCQYV